MMAYDYTIIRTSRKTLELQIKNGEVIVRSPLQVPDAQIEEFVEKHRGWIEKHLKEQEEVRKDTASQPKFTYKELCELADQACKVIPERVRYYADQMGVTYGRITIRAQHTRWGSCSAKRNLNFNCLLMLMPPEVLDCVVVHELCHLKEMNHSGRFYEEVLKLYPEYHKWNNWLKENGGRFVDMLP